MNSDTRIDASITPATYGQSAARSQDVPIYLCPSDGSANNYYNAGRNNYVGSMGMSADVRDGSSAGGIFSTPYPSGGEMKGPTLVAIMDGTSNTVMWSERMRATLDWNSGTHDNTTILRVKGLPSLYDGRGIPACATGSSYSGRLTYSGHQYYRALNFLQSYTHTLPPNWNRKMGTGTQRYNCGNYSNLNQAHIAASSYHTSGVNVCMADGSVRFISESINFPQWQALGTRSGGEPGNVP